MSEYVHYTEMEIIRAAREAPWLSIFIGPLTNDELNAIRYAVSDADTYDNEPEELYHLEIVLKDKLGPPEVPKKPARRQIGRFEFVREPDGYLWLNHGGNPTLTSDEATKLAAFIRETQP